MTAQDKITKARIHLLRDSPFVGAVALRLECKPSNCPTAQTNGKEISYNPTWIDTLTLEETKALLAHEVYHVANMHHLRRGKRNAARWNVAGDLAINPLLVADDFKLPRGGLMSDERLSAEQWYHRNESEPPPMPAAQPESAENEQGDGNGEEENEQGSSPDNVRNGSDDREDSDNDPSGQGAPAGGSTPDNQGDQPGGGGNSQDSDELDEADEPRTGWGDVVDAPEGMTETEAQEVIVQAAMIASGIGSVPAFAQRLINDWTAPPATWEEILTRYFAENASEDSSWRHPNRRHISNSLYLPGKNSGKLDEIIVAVDTSASIDEPLLSRFMAEVRNLIEGYELTVRVIYCDTEVYPDKTQIVEPGQSWEPEPTGGGGTRFAPVFSHVNQEGLDPKLLIYFTDGGSHDFGEPPSYDVVWAVYGGCYDESHFPFGEMMAVE